MISRSAKKAVILVALIGFAAISLGYSARPASAHITKKFGDLSLELGWNVEPALTGQMNAAQLTVFTGSSDKPQYVVNAMANLQTTLQYGTVTKQLQFLPSPTTEGQYLAPIIPTKEGTYVVIFKGNVQGQTVDATINLDDVASADTVNFPTTGGGSSTSSGNIPANLAGIIDQLTNDVTSAKTDASNAAQAAQADQKAVQDAKSAAEASYLIGAAGIGIGIGGIVIAVIALNRRESRLIKS